MPIAIAIGPADIVPAVLYHETAEDLLHQLRGMTFAPELKTVAEARLWLTTLAEPSGWYESPAEARTVLKRMQRREDMTAEEIAAARKALGLSRAAFAEAIGIGGNSNTRHKRIFDIEEGKALLNPTATRALRALLTAKALPNE